MTMMTRAMGMSRTESMSAATAERRAPILDLAQALKAGDIGKASEAYATLAAKAPNRAANNPDGPFAQIGTALAAGDITAARAAFAQIFTGHGTGGIGGGHAAVTDQVKASIPGGMGSLLDVNA